MMNPVFYFPLVGTAAVCQFKHSRERKTKSRENDLIGYRFDGLRNKSTLEMLEN